MPPIWMIALGFVGLAVFALGGRVAGSGRADYIASAARAFVLPWIVAAVVNLWIRWWDQQPLAGELLWLLPVIALPVAAAFLLWRQYRP